MAAGEGGDEARLRIEGGLAHFPGLAKGHSVSFDDLAPPERDTLASLADAARFFDCTPAERPAARDARTYRLGLTIAGRSRELCVTEPIEDPALATLVAAVRRLTTGR